MARGVKGGGFDALARESGFDTSDQLSELADVGEDDEFDTDLTDMAPGSAFATGGREIENDTQIDGIRSVDRRDGSTTWDYGDLLWTQELSGVSRVEAGPAGRWVVAGDGELSDVVGHASIDGTEWSVDYDGAIVLERPDRSVTKLETSGRRVDTSPDGAETVYRTDGGLIQAVTRGDASAFDPEELEEESWVTWTRRLTPLAVVGVAAGLALLIADPFGGAGEAPRPSGASQLAEASVEEPESAQLDLYCPAVADVAEHLVVLDARFLAEAIGDAESGSMVISDVRDEHDRLVTIASESANARAKGDWAAHMDATAESLDLLDDVDGDLDAYLVTESPELLAAQSEGTVFVRAQRDACVVSQAIDQ